MDSLLRLACAAAASLALLSTASAGVNAPQSGWHSGNPLLGPNALTDLACSKATCYASGEFGTLLKSTDRGSTWSGIVTGLTTDLGRVRLAGDSANRLITGSGCALRRSDDGGDTFRRLPFSARDVGCADPVLSFSFPTDKNGYLLLASGRVLSTDDGGRTFSRRAPVPGRGRDIVCTARKLCLVVGPSGEIHRTTNGGVSWTHVGSTSFGLNAVVEAAPGRLYAVGQSTAIMKSTDGGDTWTLRNVGTIGMTRIACGDALHCLVTAEFESHLVRTTDGFSSRTFVAPSSDRTNAVAFSGPTHSIAAGVLGSVEVSADAGGNWSPVGTRIAGVFGVLAPASSTVAYAGGQGGVLARTEDGGQTWSNVSAPTDVAVTDLAPIGPDRLYVLAGDGTLQRSDNRGSSYRLLNPGTARPEAIAALDANRLLLVGPRGIVRSEDAGATFDAVSDRAARGALVNEVDLAPGAVAAFSQRNGIVSTDRGLHWRRIVRPRRRAILDLDFATPRIGYLLDVRGSLWRTANGGRGWTELSSLGTSQASQIEFADARNGYAVVRSFGTLRDLGLLLRTADGGRSWYPQLVSRSAIASVRTGGATDYALAGAGHLYATTTRGDTGGAERLTLSTRSRSLRRPARITVGGRLNPADGGEEIVVARLARGRWSVRRATTASNGMFQTTWRVGETSVFVAQVLGDADHVGAGTRPLTVRVGR